MNDRMLERSWQRVASFGLIYLGLGVSSAVFSNDLEAAPVQAASRLGIFLVAVAVLLAVNAVSMSWRESSQVPMSLLSAFLIWPLATSLMASLAALVLGSLMVRVHRRTKSRQM